jgi:hypothetical protein
MIAGGDPHEAGVENDELACDAVSESVQTSSCCELAKNPGLIEEGVTARYTF